MKITITMPGPLEVENVKSEEGALVGDLIFYGKGDEATGPALKVETAAGKVLFSGYLRIGGSDGKPVVVDRSQRVKPKVEQ